MKRLTKTLFLLLILLVSITAVSASENTTQQEDVLGDSASYHGVTVTTQDLEKFYGDDIRFVANVEDNGERPSTGSVEFFS